MTDRVDNMDEQVNSIRDLVFFNASSADIKRMKVKIRDFKAWLEQMDLPNNLDNWQSYCEMTSCDYPL